MWSAEWKPGTSYNFWIRTWGHTSCFPAKLTRCVLQRACTKLWSPTLLLLRRCKLELTGMSVRCGNVLLWTARYAFFKKHNFTSVRSVYACLSVYRHNVSPHFSPLPSFQLSFLTSKQKQTFSRYFLKNPLSGPQKRYKLSPCIAVRPSWLWIWPEIVSHH